MSAAAALSLLLGVLSLLRGVAACPSRCLCFRTTVRCMFLHLDYIPTGIPPDSTVLDLRFNKIKEIPRGAFRDLGRLNTLLLNNNEIEILHDGAFEGLRDLRYLYLYKNRIRIIEPDVFKDLPKLEQLFLHSNNLETLPRGLLTHSKHLRRLRLDANALVCDCQMVWLAQMLKEKHGHTQAAATCQQPRSLQGRSLMSVAMDEFHCEKPHFTMEPRDVDVTFGNTAYFTCRAEGNPDPEITWMHNEIDVNLDNERYSLLDDGTLMIQDTQEQDKGAYECVARNAVGEVKAAKVELRYFGEPEMPKFMETPTDVTASVGDAIQLQCQASGQPRPDISWTRNGVRLSGDRRFTLLPDGSLAIADLREEDAGVYSCQAANSVLTISSKARVVVQVPPRSDAVPESQTVETGGTAVFNCSANGDPTPVITWSRSDDLLPNNGRYVIGSGGQTLTILRVEEADAGHYVCSAESAAGRDEDRVLLTVTGGGAAPRFLESHQMISASMGERVTIPCEASGNPEPQYRWTREGTPIRSEDRHVVSGRFLTILDVQIHDSGRYECTATNSAGYAVRTVVINIQGFLSGVSPDLYGFRNRHRGPADRRRSHRRIPESQRGPALIETPPPRRFQPTTPLPNFVRNDDFDNQRSDNNQRFDNTRFDNNQRFDNTRFDNTQRFDNNQRFDNTQRFDNERFDSRRPVVQTPPRRQQEDETFIPRTPEDRVIQSAINQARQNVDQAIDQTRAHLFDRTRTHTVSELLAIFRYPNPEALELARAEEIFEQTLEIITRHVQAGHRYNLSGHEATYRDLVSPAHLALIANMSGCMQEMPDPECSDTCFHRQYRTADGSCNNFEHPKWGSGNMAFLRHIPPNYENGLNTPIGWNRAKIYNGFHLPSPRLVSSLMMSTDHVTIDENHTHMIMQWGQFFDHDLDLTPQSVSFARFSDGRRCNETCDNSHPCFPIPVPNSDPRIQNHACLGFTRSSAICNTGTTAIFFNTVSPRQQINAVTAFLDASNVYGSSQRETEDLRDFSNNRGLLRQGPQTAGGKRLLPFDSNTLHPSDCQIEPSKRHVPCFKTGDHRANEQVSLTAMHTLWVREHNRIANVLVQLNPHWDGNKIFHETRKILGAVMQHITYQHWLPNILGPKGMEQLGSYQGYDPLVNPSVTNEFATAAMRFGHSLVQPVMFRLNSSYLPVEEGNLQLHQAFFSPYRLIEEGGIDPLLRGLFGVAAKKRMPDEMLNNELTERLFGLANTVGQDLASLNIQRGRDHGLPSYNAYRQACNMSAASSSFNSLRDTITHRSTREKLQALYGHPDNIDLFVGGMSETPMDGAKIGPTLMCIMVDQFRRLRDGDRFWYENPGVFTPEQLAQIRRASLARVICDSSDNIDSVQPDVFMRAEIQGGRHACSSIPAIDLRMWTDCCEDCRRRGGAHNAFQRRFRRSAEHSFPEDRPALDPTLLQPLEQSETVVEGGRGQARGQREDNRPVEDYLLYNVTVKEGGARGAEGQEEGEGVCGLRDCEVMEDRIEAMEALVEILQSQVEGMQHKLHSLQRQVRRRRGKKCSYRGKVFSNLSRWSPDDCTSCLCKRGQVECTTQSCPALTCDSPLPMPGECCPAC